MIQALFTWGMIQSLLISVLLPVGRSNKGSYLLSSLFLVTALNIFFQYVLRFTSIKNDFSRLLVIPDMLDLLLPSLLYTYLISILAEFTLRKHYIYFMLPLFWATVLLLFTLQEKDFHFYKYIDTELHFASQILVFLWKLLLFLKVYQLFRQQRKLNQLPAEALRWLRTLTTFMGMIALVSTFNLSFFTYRWISVDLELSLIRFLRSVSEFNYIVLTCFIIFINTYFFIRHPEVFARSPSPVGKASDQNRKKFDKIFRNLKVLEDQQLLFDSELDEGKLAKQLGVKSYLLSQFLNQRLGKSFTEFINEKRIEEAKRLLEKAENRDTTIFAIGVDSGFRSESSFYFNFKKYTGMTPKQYKNQFSEF